mgnify:CR=1 FL=1
MAKVNKCIIRSVQGKPTNDRFEWINPYRFTTPYITKVGVSLNPNDEAHHSVMSIQITQWIMEPYTRSSPEGTASPSKYKRFLIHWISGIGLFLHWSQAVGISMHNRQVIPIFREHLMLEECLGLKKLNSVRHGSENVISMEMDLD